MLSEKLIVPYELAALLKEKGFDWDCIYHYKVSPEDPTRHSKYPTFEARHALGKNHNALASRVSGPLWTQVIDWLYKKSQGDVVVFYDPTVRMDYRIKEFEQGIKLIK